MEPKLIKTTTFFPLPWSIVAKFLGYSQKRLRTWVMPRHGRPSGDSVYTIYMISVPIEIIDLNMSAVALVIVKGDTWRQH